MRIKKEIIRPGTYFYIDEDTGLPRCATFAAADVKHFHDSGKAMRAAGLSIPVPFEHQRDHKPLTAAEKSANTLKHNAGWVDDFLIEDVNETDASGNVTVVKDVLFGQLDIPDAEVVKKLPHTIRWSSPWINSFTDGAGTPWNNVISHLALTSRPRIVKQQPFPSIAAAMSYAGMIKSQALSLATMPKGSGLSVSRAGLLRQDHTLRPAYPIAFSLWTGAKLAASEVAEEMKKPAKKKSPAPGKPGGTSAPDKPPGDSPPEMPEGPQDAMDLLMPMEEPLVDQDGDISVYEVIKDLLETIGITMPDDTDKDNFCENLYQAAMEKIKGLGAKTGETDMPPPMTPDKPPASPLVQEQPPLLMSLEEVNKITDPRMKSMALSMLAVQKKNKALEDNLLADARVRRDRRIEALAKRLPQAARDKLLTMSKSVQFSLGDDGVVADPMASWIDIMEAGVPNLPDLLGNPLGTTTEQEHPREYAGALSEDRRKAVTAELRKNAGLEEQTDAA